MKMSIDPFKLLIVLVVSISCGRSVKEISSLDQKRKLEVEYSLINNRWEERNRIKYEYDDEGYLEEQRNSRLNDSIWVDYFVNYSYYDKEKNLKKSRRDAWKNNNWERIFTSTYFYDSGKISKRIDSTYSPLLVVNHIYTYNDNAQLIEELGTINKDSVRNFNRLLHSYNDSGLVQEKRWQNYQEGTWIDKRKMLFEYDESNNHIRTLKQNYIDGQWVGFMDYQLTVSNQGLRTDAFWKIWKDSSWLDYKKVKYYY